MKCMRRVADAQVQSLAILLEQGGTTVKGGRTPLGGMEDIERAI